MINLIHRKESNILTAVEIINELGIQGIYTRKIARCQEISEGKQIDVDNFVIG